MKALSASLAVSFFAAKRGEEKGGAARSMPAFAAAAKKGEEEEEARGCTTVRAWCGRDRSSFTPAASPSPSLLLLFASYSRGGGMPVWALTLI